MSCCFPLGRRCLRSRCLQESIHLDLCPLAHFRKTLTKEPPPPPRHKSSWVRTKGHPAWASTSAGQVSRAESRPAAGEPLAHSPQLQPPPPAPAAGTPAPQPPRLILRGPGAAGGARGWGLERRGGGEGAGELPPPAARTSNQPPGPGSRRGPAAPPRTAAGNPRTPTAAEQQPEVSGGAPPLPRGAGQPLGRRRVRGGKRSARPLFRREGAGRRPRSEAEVLAGRWSQT